MSEVAWVSPSAIVESGVELGPGTKVWEFAKIRAGARIGARVTIGMGVYVGPGVVIGDDTKIQNYALVYEPAEIGRGAFIGPGVILTNDKYPAAIREDGIKKREKDWVKSQVVVEDGASIGAGSICVAPVIVGSRSLVGAGSVVTKNVRPNALVYGNPAEEQTITSRST